MSFLTRSNASLAETSPQFYSKIDDKSKRLPIYKNSPGLRESLDDFRQGIRHRIAEKLNANTNKFIEIPSPQKNKTLKERFETNLLSKDRTSPKRPEPAYLRQSSPSLLKSTDKRFNFVQELKKKFGDRSSPRRSPLKDAMVMASLERKGSNKGTFISSSGFKTSFGIRNRSPVKDYELTIEARTPNPQKTPLGSRMSFIEEKAMTTTTTRTPKERKENIIKLLDNSSTTRLKSSGLRLETDRPQRGLVHQLNQLRASKISILSPSPKKGEDLLAITPTKYSRENLKTLSNFVSESFKSRDNYEREPAVEHARRLDLFNGSLESRAFNYDRLGLSDRVPLSKLNEMEDLFSNVSDKEFNNLSPEYVEELIKLSSVIMQRVKGSAYYTRE